MVLTVAPLYRSDINAHGISLWLQTCKIRCGYGTHIEYVLVVVPNVICDRLYQRKSAGMSDASSLNWAMQGTADGFIQLTRERGTVSHSVHR